MASNAYSPATLQAELERIRQRKANAGQANPNSQLQPRDYRNTSQDINQYAPQQLDTPMYENPLREGTLKAINQGDQQATATAIIEAQNRHNLEEWRKAQRQLQKARQNQVKKTAQLNFPELPTATGGGPQGGGLPSEGKFGIGTNLTTFTAGGHSWTLNKYVADRFKGFINELVNKKGYNIYSAGSYNKRKIAGTNTWSLHSYGLAIDINPDKNPVTYGKVVTNLPKGIAALAAKYGLTWGGSWQGSKKDSMHFSIPYKGTK